MAISKPGKMRRHPSGISPDQSRLLADVIFIAETLANKQKDQVSERLEAFIDSTIEYFTSLKSVMPFGDRFEIVTSRLQKFKSYIQNAESSKIIGDAKSFTMRNLFEALAWSIATCVLTYAYYLRAQDKTGRKSTEKFRTRSHQRRKQLATATKTRQSNQ